MSDFSRLHPAIQHHIVNSLGWRQLRPLQEAAIDPLLAGHHALILAGTAGGKTEAALFPLLSRMLNEEWRGLGILYLCPIKALLNNLEVRLSQYAGWLGRRAMVWHGDVSESERRRMRKDPPDILLTTPESLEVMLLSRRADPSKFFSGVRAVVVDEIHAFAGDARGRHLLSVVEGIARLVDDPVQRVGLSATVGNPEVLVDWLAASAPGPREVIRAASATVAAPPEILVDHVGSLANAAKVIAALHRGEKRLVFCDSRARVEQLGIGLRELGVSTFVSHSSLGQVERRRAGAACAAGRDCVVVATSTLELGIDVGDLDRIIQIDAPATVASFLQRLGRTGRRPGAQRNCLFLTTSETGFLRALGLLELWADGFVEPTLPPPEPLHVFAQQVLAFILQEGGVDRETIKQSLRAMSGFACLDPADLDAIFDHMLERSILVSDGGLLGLGPEAERLYGAKNFLKLFSVFSAPPLFVVFHGRNEIGSVDETMFHVRQAGAPILLLAGRNWRVTHLDRGRRVAYVEPVELRGRSHWLGPGQALHFRLCRAIRTLLASGRTRTPLSNRAQEYLTTVLAGFAWVQDDATCVVTTRPGHSTWWTFAGLLANQVLAEAFSTVLALSGQGDNFEIALHDHADLEEAERLLTSRTKLGPPPLDDDAISALEFSACLPRSLAERLLRRRLFDEPALHACLSEPIRFVGGA